MEIIFFVEYLVYLVIRGDQDAIVKVFSNHSLLRILLLCCMTYQLIMLRAIKYRDIKCVIRCSRGGFYTIPIFLVYVFQCFGEYSSFNNILSMLLMVLEILVVVELANELGGVGTVALVSYISLSGYVVYSLLTCGLTLSELLQNVNVGTFFSSNYNQRFRFTFGYQSPNIFAGTCLCAILASFVYLKSMGAKRRKKSYAYIRKVLIIIIDVLLFMLIIISGSRGAIFGGIIFAITYLYFKVGKISVISEIQIRFTRRILLLIGAAVVGVIIYIYGIEYYLNSGRWQALKNLSFLNDFGRVLFGIGLPEVGFESLRIGDNTGGYLDNYYIYLLVTTGICGTIVVLGSIILIGKKIEKFSETGILVYSIYVMTIFYGIVESCILTPSYLSSEIYFAIFLSFINETYKSKINRGTLSLRK